jgi:hypothetical protein
MLSKLQEKLHEVLVGKDNTHISNTQEKSEENDKIYFRITPEEDADLINVTYVSHVKDI